MQIPKPIPGAELPARSIEEYRGRTDPGAVKAVAQEMEAMFAYELLKAMRATSDTSSKGGLGPNTYTSLFDMELSKLIAKRGIGLKDMLLKGIEKRAAAHNTGENTAVTEHSGVTETATGMMKKATKTYNGKDIDPAAVLGKNS
jgi:Rod binding domain-containing protein